MAYELKPNQGTLFATKVKKHPKAPDYFGELLVEISTLEVVNGVAKVKLGGWKIKSESSGNTFLSIKIDTWKPDGEKQAQPQSNNGDMDDDIPF
jgi:hypothetical protein